MHTSCPMLPHITAPSPCSPMALLATPDTALDALVRHRLHQSPPYRVQAAHFGSLHVSLEFMADTWMSKDKAFQKNFWLRTPTQESPEAQAESCCGAIPLSHGSDIAFSMGLKGREILQSKRIIYKPSDFKFACNLDLLGIC